MKPSDITEKRTDGRTGNKKNLNYLRGFIFIASLLSLFTVFLNPINAKADMGPKQSVEITVNNYDDSYCYAILFSEYNGQYYQVAPGQQAIYNAFFEKNELENAVRDIYNAVKETLPPYTDEYNKGYPFYYVFYISDEDNMLDCSYMLPEKYFLVLYYPETDTILRSDFYSNYAFNSYYTVDASQLNEDGFLVLTEPPKKEIITKNLMPLKIAAAVYRLILTLAMEIGLAFAFRIRGKKSLLTVVLTNIATQAVLNVCLFYTSYNYGDGRLYMLEFFAIEFFIFIAEAVVYSIVLKKTNNPPVRVRKAILYSLAANAVTMMAGFIPTLISGI